MLEICLVVLTMVYVGMAKIPEIRCVEHILRNVLELLACLRLYVMHMMVMGC